MIFSLKAALDQSAVIPSNTFQISPPLNFSEVHLFTLNDHFSRMSILKPLPTVAGGNLSMFVVMIPQESGIRAGGSFNEK